MEKRALLDPVVCIDNKRIYLSPFWDDRTSVCGFEIGSVYYPTAEDGSCYLFVDSHGNGIWLGKKRFVPHVETPYDPNQQGETDDDI